MQSIIVLLSHIDGFRSYAHIIRPLLGQGRPNFPPTHPESSPGEASPLIVTLFSLFWLLLMIGFSIMALFSLYNEFDKHTATVKSVVVGLLFFAATSTLAGVIGYHLFFMK
jgi:hypothetical protein